MVGGFQNNVGSASMLAKLLPKNQLFLAEMCSMQSKAGQPTNQHPVCMCFEVKLWQKKLKQEDVSPDRHNDM